MKNLPLILSLSLLSLISIFTLSGCVDLDDAYRSPSSQGRYDDYRRDGYNDRRNDWDRNSTRDERYRLEQERERAEAERRRLEDERRRAEEERRRDSWRPPPQVRVEEHCPSGFSPSEQKCSKEERRRGCRDMRLPGGLGCVSR